MPPTHYTRTAKSLHWLMALRIFGLLVLLAFT
jgi:cytochrome b561